MWCVMYVKEKKESEAEDFVAGLLPRNLYARCFHLTRTRKKKYEGRWRTVKEDLLPGYVFIDTDQPDKVHEELKRVPGSGLLFSDDTWVSTLERHETDLMEALADENGVIGISAVRIGEDKIVRYLSGPLANVRNRVKKINLHKRIAEVEVSLSGRGQILYLGIDIEGRKG